MKIINTKVAVILSIVIFIISCNKRQNEPMYSNSAVSDSIIIIDKELHTLNNVEIDSKKSHNQNDILDKEYWEGEYKYSTGDEYISRFFQLSLSPSDDEDQKIFFVLIGSGIQYYTSLEGYVISNDWRRLTFIFERGEGFYKNYWNVGDIVFELEFDDRKILTYWSEGFKEHLSVIDSSIIKDGRIRFVKKEK